MEQYIKKSALVAEIERRIKGLNACHADRVAGYAGEISGLERLLSFLNTLEVKEVDLDMEVALWANAIPEIRLDDIERLAKYFFELGLKTQKGE